MIIEALMVAALIVYRSWYVLIIVCGLVAFRRMAWLANAIADRFELDATIGMTLWAARLALPAWDGARVMSENEEELEETIAQVAVHVPVPGTAGASAIAPPDRDITRDAWIEVLALAHDENGRDVFSANQIHAAIGGRRAAVLARVKAVRSNAPPAQFRQPDSTTAPADFPITRSA